MTKHDMIEIGIRALASWEAELSRKLGNGKLVADQYLIVQRAEPKMVLGNHRRHAQKGVVYAYLIQHDLQGMSLFSRERVISITIANPHVTALLARKFIENEILELKENLAVLRSLPEPEDYND